MFVRKVLNWIIPLEESKYSIEENESVVTEQVETKPLENRQVCTPRESPEVSTPSFGTATSLLQFSLEPDKDPADVSNITVENSSLINSDVGSNCRDDDMLTKDLDPNQKTILRGNYPDANQIRYRSNDPLSNQESIISKGAGDGISNNADVSRLSPLCKKILQSRFCSSSRKSCYTQTENKNTRRHRDIKLIPTPKKAVEFESTLTTHFSCDCELPSSVRTLLQQKETRFSNIKSATSSDTCLYGELLVLGCNGTVPDHLTDQMDCRLLLRKRPKPNGVKEAFSYITSRDHPLTRTSDKHTVYYQLSAARSVVVEYVRDKSTDMFQIGRFEMQPVDFRVLDLSGGDRARNGVSRFACRVSVQRFGNHEARVYAAAFDATGHIFLGEGALTCVREGKMDGFTTNGVLIMHPKANRVWREVSVCGFIYPLRSPNMEAKKRPRLLEETNVLQDGTLINLCGVTLLWRTPSGLRKTPSRECLKRIESELLNWSPEYEIPQKSLYRDRKDKISQAFVFLSCGHVLGLLGGGQSGTLEGWTCPVCRSIGPIAKLRIGKEPGFYADSDFLTHAFRPCGHASTLKTVQYWSTIKVPEHRNIQEGFCPFCGTKLNSISKYIELKYPQ